MSVGVFKNGQYVKTAGLPKDTPIFTPASETESGASGLVVAPLKGDQNKFLKGDGTWATDNNTTYTFIKEGQLLKITGSDGTSVDITLGGEITKAAVEEALGVTIGEGYKIGDSAVSIKAYIDSRIFVGTQEEFDAAKVAGTVDDSAFVLISDSDGEELIAITTDEVNALFD